MSKGIYFDPPAHAGLGFQATPPDVPKEAIGKIAQLIPGPVLGAYGAALGTLPLFAPTQQPWVGLGLFLLGIAGTAWLVTWQMDDHLRKSRHVVAYSAAFSVWAYSLTGQHALPWVYHEGLGALLPILAAFVLYNLRLPRLEKG